MKSEEVRAEVFKIWRNQRQSEDIRTGQKKSEPIRQEQSMSSYPNSIIPQRIRRTSSSTVPSYHPHTIPTLSTRFVESVVVDRSDLYDVVLSCQKIRVEYGGRMWMWMVVGEEDGGWGLQEAGLNRIL
ncbi:hypothetical protein GCK72_016289 [Caenorhabditis remanei]|uniref:Uncharacterized protein n=1 Tax=Caenorhabditis remanei TaxID=31234 RepID=A0A6A5GZT6_CAERE|nr:hypothetical protein GCK72_016289 [Caenorhabditis remanei]KAF1759822.1 hypothetical protein GCK72_016289 [Caenorhabditis remanei]